MRHRAPARRLILVALWAAALGAASLKAAQELEPPETLFGDLFVDVQTRHVFADGKEFVDAVPKSDPVEILRSYHEAIPPSAEALRAFVEAHFVLPAAVVAEPAPSTRIPITDHIDGLWAQLTRSTPQVPPYSSALALPRPYVVPGGRFRELYYWDSYFTMLGLAESGRFDRIEDMVSDFAYLIDAYGHVPNGARSYYLSRSQPPFFFAMVGLLSPEDPAKSFARYLPELRREYAYLDGRSRAASSGSRPSACRRVAGRRGPQPLLG